MTEKEITKNAIEAAKRDGYNQVVYKDENNTYAFSRDYPANTMYKKEDVIGHVYTGWTSGIFHTVYCPDGPLNNI